LLLWQFTGAKKKLRLEESARVVANNPTALFMLSAFFVGREAFEVLVFLQALSLRAGGFSISILFGISIAIVFLVVVYLFFNHLVNRLPMKLIFVISSVWLIVQAGLIVWEVMS
jgi:high-affinity iron transporter